MQIEQSNLDQINKKLNINIKIIKPTSTISQLSSSPSFSEELTKKYYLNKEIQKILFSYSSNREVIPQFKQPSGDIAFGKRPDTLNYPSDVELFVSKGATSFHVSNEIWQNLQNLVPGMNQQQLNSQRIGWDMLIDIDCVNKDLFEVSRLTARLILRELDNYGVKSASIKFSGNKGFHIAIPWSAFPETIKGQKTNDLFPEAARNIATFLQHKIKNQLAREINNRSDLDKLINLAGKTFEEVTERDSQGKSTGNLDPFTLVDIDTVLISPRHLYRMPYSLHEKTGLISLPILKSELESFVPQKASTTLFLQNPVVNYKFLKEADEKDATGLLLQALDFCTGLSINKEANEKSTQKISSFDLLGKGRSKIQGTFQIESFPPCMKNILNGMGDGKKRAMFALINFLKSINWNDDEIEKLILDWNKKNTDKSEPLKEQYIKAQLRYAKSKKDSILPPNCKSYYEGLRVCTPDNICNKIKNPVGYPLVQVRINNQKNDQLKKQNKSKKK